VPGFFQGIGKWQHIAWVKAGTTYNFYRDGVLIATRPAPGAFNIEPTGFNIGQVGKSFWKGSIDSAGVWSIARTADQVRDDMYREANPAAAGLMGAWSFNEASGFIVDDTSQRNNFGSLRGNTAFSTDTPPVAFTTRAGFPISGSLPGFDADGEPLSFSVAGPPANGTVSVNRDG
jgi:hypothetical protein